MNLIFVATEKEAKLCQKAVFNPFNSGELNSLLTNVYIFILLPSTALAVNESITRSTEEGQDNRHHLQNPALMQTLKMDALLSSPS